MKPHPIRNLAASSEHTRKSPVPNIFISGGITPRNCFKLMGFEFEDSELLTREGFSASSQYIMAGDSVCVPVLEKIFKNLL